jgi:uncharacterized protein
MLSVMNAAPDIDFVEVSADDLLTASQHHETLAHLSEKFPLVLCGSGLSVATIGVLDMSYMRALRRLSELTGCACHRDYIAMTRVPGITLSRPIPVWGTPEVLRSTVAHVRTAQQYLGKPLLLQDVAGIAAETMAQRAEFVGRLIAATNCGIVVDVAALHRDFGALGVDPLTYLAGLPAGSPVRIRLAGDERDGGWPDDEDIWALVAGLCARFPVQAAVLGHWQNAAGLADWQAAAARMRSLLKAS